MSRGVLTARHRNRALLARQLLLDRPELDLPAALEQVAGLQTQYAPSAYIGLWSRLRDFTRPMLTDALVERRAIQGTLMRSTIHTVSAADYWPLAIAVHEPRRAWWLRALRRELDGVDLEAAAEAMREELAGGPLRERELKARLAARGFPRLAAVGAAFSLDLVRVPPSGTWERRRADLYGLADAWLPPPVLTTDEATDHLVRRYLAGFGPASAADIASFAGLPVTGVRGALARIGHVTYADEAGKELLDLPEAPLPDPETPAPVRFLGTWEALLLVHARGTGVLPEAHRPRIFHTRAPHSFNTFLVDGQVAGTWRHEPAGIALAPFDPLAPADRRALDEEAHRLEAFLA